MTDLAEQQQARGEAIYAIHRQRILDEYNLINHRLMWLVLSESAMISALLLSKDFPGRIYIAVLVILLGLGIAFLCWKAVDAAHAEIDSQVDDYKRKVKGLIDPDDLRITGKPQNHRWGSLLEKLLPPAMLVLWALVACVVAVLYAKGLFH